MDRDEFMELVYETFADEPDNVLANGIIEAADAYAEHEKAQLSCEGTTSDRISGIDTISVPEIFTQTDTLGHTPRQIVEALPSAQPDHVADIGKKVSISCGQENDMISRQAAIETISRMMPKSYTLDGSHPADEEIFMAQEIYADCIKAIEILPIVQPERIWHSCKTPPKHHKDVLVRGTEAIDNVTIYKVMQWDVDTWRPINYAPSIIWEEWSEI